MLSLTHTLISLPFAIYFQNPFLIFAASFVFHLFTDTLLHWNIYPHEFKKYPTALVAVDVVSGLIISWLLVGNDLFTLPFLAAIAGGNMPDILHALWEITPQPSKDKYGAWVKPFYSFHGKLQLETTSVWLGLISQIALISLSFYLLQ